MQEIWKDIRDYEGYYQISNLGRVKNRKGNIKSTKMSNSGYLMVNLYIGKKGKTKYIHRLLAEAFIPNPQNKREVNHIDECKTNNDLSNLEWVTHRENRMHGTLIKRQSDSLKKHYETHNHKNSMEIVCIENGKSFKSQAEASRVMGISSAMICECVNGIREKACGYSFKHKESEGK